MRSSASHPVWPVAVLVPAVAVFASLGGVAEVPGPSAAACVAGQASGSGQARGDVVARWLTCLSGAARQMGQQVHRSDSVDSLSLILTEPWAVGGEGLELSGRVSWCSRLRGTGTRRISPRLSDLPPPVV